MSTDLHDRRPPSPEEDPDQRKAPKSSLSIAQIVGGALAAMTAAALGSRLSLAGTVLGAAFASVIAAVAGAIYTASLRRTTKGVSTVIARVRPAGSAGGPVGGLGPAAPGTTAVTTTARSTDDTRVDPTDGWALAPDPAGAAVGPAPTPSPTGETRRARVGWKQVLVGALLMFVVAALVLTGIELATGRALSGGDGTTVGQVAEPATRPTPTPTPRASATSTPTPTPSTATSSTPSTAPSATAAPSSTPSSEPTAAPTPSGSPVPSGIPSAVPSSTPTAAPSAPGATPTP